MTHTSVVQSPPNQQRKRGGTTDRASIGLSRFLIASALLLSAAPATVLAQSAAPAAAPAAPAAPAANGPCDPYKNYECLDGYLGTGFWERLTKYYSLEWGQPGAPSDPKAPPGRRDDFPPAAQTTPPMPFTEWPYGGTTSLGVTRPNSMDSPLMTALAPTSFGQFLNENHFQIYGWINVGGNVSNMTQKPGGNFPAAYMYTPNTVTLDQAVLYIDRFPDTVQKDHIDWGVRLSGLYGEDYRYTTSYGLASYQLLDKNRVNGYDFPMFSGELFIPYVGEGLMLRLGRFISLPDIEAQLAPNNYMYSHSMTYGYDNYTNQGLQASLALTKNWTVQLGLTSRIGHDSPALARHADQSLPERSWYRPRHRSGTTRCIQGQQCQRPRRPPELDVLRSLQQRQRQG